LLRVKVATNKVATAIKWVKVANRQKKLENPPKNANIRTAEAKNPPVHWLWFPLQFSWTSDHCLLTPCVILKV
jgi:hypothetical protein